MQHMKIKAEIENFCEQQDSPFNGTGCILRCLQIDGLQVFHLLFHIGRR